MSIATEITRLQGAKSDLKTSIEAKGVTVPSATLISGYAALVDQIETGGGGGVPDSDGLVDLEISTGDQSNVFSFTLEYIPTYLRRYAPSSAISTLNSITIPSSTVTYPTITWSSNKTEITISGYTANVAGGFNDDATFTATWVDCYGITRTTTKTIHIITPSYMIKTGTSIPIPSNRVYVVIGTNVSASDIKLNGTGTGLDSGEVYNGKRISMAFYAGTYTTSWGADLTFLSNDNVNAAVFASVADAKAAIDTL